VTPPRILTLVVLVSCGSSSGGGQQRGDASPNDARVDAVASDASPQRDAGRGDAPNSGTDAKSDAPPCAGPHPASCIAVTTTVATSDLCKTLTLFYYELGTATATQLSGTGGQHYAATTGDEASPPYSCLESGIGMYKNGCPASIDVTSRTQKVTWASASKWVYGSFVAETQQVSSGGPASVPGAQQPFMNFTSGYTNMTDNGMACTGSVTPTGCLALNPLYTETVAANVGIFDYDSGHFENHAGTYGGIAIARSGATGSLTADIQKGLGVTWASSFYTSPLIAGGIYGPIADYVTVLQAIMKGDLAIAKDMTCGASCTQDGASYSVGPTGKSVTPFTCTAGGSPLAPEKDYYSFGHWIEADATYGGDFSFSSAGSYGVYPALTADLSTYEVISRDAQPGYYSGGQQGFNTLRCGVGIRKAWLTGVAQ
jgi:hypothetical protein